MAGESWWWEDIGPTDRHYQSVPGDGGLSRGSERVLGCSDLEKISLYPTDSANYCPVSNLLFLGKVTERVVLKQPQSFLDGTSTLVPFHSGFCPSHKTKAVLLALLDDLRRHLDWGSLVLLLLLIFTVVFNIVDYNFLTHCLANMGFHEVALKWLFSFPLSQGQSGTEIECQLGIT